MSIRKLMIGFLSLSLILSGCASGKSEQAATVEAYLNALVEKDGDRMASLSCAAWEEDAAQELDSFQAVEAELRDLTCTNAGSEGEAALVKCTGKIVTTYNAEKQELDLSLRTYRIIEEAGEQRVCGYE